ncbi:SET domain-containing protein [Dothidotthia symphoricarpi CBS 119687]|uniref:SET domain-containing protein n=1 Tax=Dothidotthia symphoricarpi CBS 119687 TaxID=1392245 RepID=A0A6A6A8J6_9PLEO|nr:SET domain-containing protein [Dothidotthia symphoricarpi CBS 119687]KAF2127128.1 SET domain-containing protein [Dothidotthia symphoricarpi CBS 119687]
MSAIPLHRCPDLEIKLDTPKGRGVFATKDIPAKTVVDVCTVLVLGLEENALYVGRTALYHYTYNWPVADESGKKRIAQAVVFGLGSMFNHSTQEQNVSWERNAEHEIITYRALRDIRAGEELCISYGSRLTFKDTDAPTPPPPEEEMEQLLQIQLE